MTAEAQPHTFYGPHPETLANGTPLENGRVVTPNPDSAHDQHLIERGWLVPGAAKADPLKRPGRASEQED